MTTQQDGDGPRSDGVATEAPSNGWRILMVEDDIDNRNVYRLLLQHRGFQVIEAQTGTEGVERARADLPDLILLDISIPELNGWEVTKILKAEEATRSIPILVVSANGQAADRRRAESLGCAGYLVKPIAPSQMVEEVTLRLNGQISFSSH